MGEENLQPGAPVAADSGAAAPAEQPSLLSEQEKGLLAQLPDFLVNTVSENDLHRAAGLDVPAPAAEPPADPAAPAADPAAAPVDASAAPAAPAAPEPPDPVQVYFDQQAKVNQQIFEALSAITNKLAPPPAPPAPPPARKLEDMSEEEQFVHLMQQDMLGQFKSLLDERFKPLDEERAANKAAAEKAAAEAAFRSRADGIYQAADAAVGEVVGADKVAGLSAEDKRAVADEILSAQAAHAEATDASGKMVGITPSQAAAMVKARWARMARLFGAPAGAAPQGRPAVPRAQVGRPSHVGAPGVVQPTPYVDPNGNQVAVPDAREIHKHYGGSTDRILDGLADGFSKARPRS